jgi:hypothetical protein
MYQYKPVLQSPSGYYRRVHNGIKTRKFQPCGKFGLAASSYIGKPPIFIDRDATRWKPANDVVMVHDG